jgi:hydrogenase maturation protease
MSIAAEPGRAPAVVIAVGNEMRGDDGVGIEVAARLEGRLPPGVELVRTRGDATALLDLWKGRTLAVVVDAVDRGGVPGEVLTFDVLGGGLRVGSASASTHDFGLAQALELGLLMGALPEAIGFVGVVGARFGIGEPMGPEVRGALGEAAQRVLDALAGHIGGSPCTSDR